MTVYNVPVMLALPRRKQLLSVDDQTALEQVVSCVRRTNTA